MGLKNSDHLSRRLLLCGALASWAVVGASAALSQPQDDSLARIKSQGKVRIGFANINPYGYVMPDGRVTGQAPELIRAFFADMGVSSLEPVVTDFGSLIGGLVAKRFDIVATGMLIQPERCKIVSFGDPEYQINRAFAVKKGNPKGVTSFVSLARHADAKIGLLTGAGEIRFSELAGIPQERRLLFPDLSAAIAGLQAGRVDAVVASTVTIRGALSRANDPRLDFAALSEQPRDESGNESIGYGGMAFRKDDISLREAWNTWLAKALKSGRVTSIIEPFGFGPETLPKEGTTAEYACAERK
ncbi:ectoine/hydroxyectoine ABC transporter substrate-binding protein EhuB [Bosea sp. 2RAB26]